MTRKLEFLGLLGIPKKIDPIVTFTYAPKIDPDTFTFTTHKEETEKALRNSAVEVLPSDAGYDVIVHGKKMGPPTTLKIAEEKATWCKLFLAGKLGAQTEREFNEYRYPNGTRNMAVQA